MPASTSARPPVPASTHLPPMHGEPFTFTLPPALEAHEPPEARGLRRDEVRLLVTHRSDSRVVHARFRDLARHLEPGDLLVANDSATLPAALTAQRSDGSTILLHFSTELGSATWAVEPRAAVVGASETSAQPGAAARTSETPPLRGAEVGLGERLALPGGGTARLRAPYHGSRRLWVADLRLPEPAPAYLARWGRPIAYPYVHGSWPIEDYQTVYAVAPGSAEMPSAGRAFTPEVLRCLAERGVGFATLTLHTGVASLEKDEPPYPERFRVPAATAAAVRATRARGGRLVAVGTTVVRALESVVSPDGHVEAGGGWTDLVVTPARGVRSLDGLLTGFHEPRASHLAMLEAFAGRAHLERAYQEALAHGYLWHEFGDLHLIL